MTPIERAARAVREAFEKEARDSGNWITEPHPETGAWSYEGEVPVGEIVRAVLAAIREPSEGMVTAGGEQVLDTEFGSGQYESIADGRGSKITADDQAMKAYQAMIDAALAEGKPA